MTALLKLPYQASISRSTNDIGFGIKLYEFRGEGDGRGSADTALKLPKRAFHSRSVKREALPRNLASEAAFQASQS
jgi:hypothetical protein